jgi:hypothetical protein
MKDDQRLGAMYWIDHFVVGTTDVPQWAEWADEVLGASHTWNNTDARGPQGAVFRDLGGCHIAAFLNERMPPDPGLGKGMPRYGMYIRVEDVDRQLNRLDQLGVRHTEPWRETGLGEPGVAIAFEDFDHNQYELWAPDELPDGAMDGIGEVGVGRLSHAIFESRDFARTTAFYSRYCGVDPLPAGNVDDDTLVFPLVAAGRLIFKKVEQLGMRTGGSTRVFGAHTAFIVRNEDFLPAYEKLWADLSEWNYDRRAEGPLADPGALPARTGMHGSEAGRMWKKVYGRGDAIIDADTNNFHFVGGTSSEPTMARYQAHYMEEHIEAYLKQHPEAAEKSGGAAR